jgi:hypothetical protein
MHTITGQDHDQGAGPITVFRHRAEHATDCARLMGECGYRRVTVLDLDAMTTLDDVRTFLACVHDYEPVDWRVLERAFAVVFGRAPEPIERHPWLLLESIRRAVALAAAGGA